MKVEMRIARMLAENVDGFIKFVQETYENRNKSYIENPDKLYQVKLLVEEYKFQLNADELLRINQFSWDERYTTILVDSIREGRDVIEEYVNNHYADLFIVSARLHTIKDLCTYFSK
ncbi:hypothetical protein [Ferdinandcohnia sp. Marseille-Q9671]